MIDLPYLRSIQTSGILNRINFLENSNSESALKVYDSKYGFYGKPITFRIPRLKTTYMLQQLPIINNSARVSNSKAYFDIIDNSEAGLIGDTLIYGGEDFKLMESVALLTEGDRIIISTDHNWNYTYEITRKIIVPNDQNYVLDDNNTSKVLIAKEHSNSTLYLEAEFKSIEEVI